VKLTTLTVPSRIEFVRPATAFLVQAARAMDVRAAGEPVFEVAISEAITNAVKHGASASRSTITCEIERGDGGLVIRIIDDGEGFAVREAPLPDVSRDRIDALPSSGYGLPIIQTVFPTVRVITVDGRFALELRLPAEPALKRKG
jgi:anti-sigma regulatory factor (Ser/Thr protein kinase)